MSSPVLTLYSPSLCSSPANPRSPLIYSLLALTLASLASFSPSLPGLRGRSHLVQGHKVRDCDRRLHVNERCAGRLQLDGLPTDVHGAVRAAVDVGVLPQRSRVRLRLEAVRGHTEREAQVCGRASEEGEQQREHRNGGWGRGGRGGGGGGVAKRSHGAEEDGAAANSHEGDSHESNPALNGVLAFDLTG